MKCAHQEDLEVDLDNLEERLEKELLALRDQVGPLTLLSRNIYLLRDHAIHHPFILFTHYVCPPRSPGRQPGRS